MVEVYEDTGGRIYLMESKDRYATYFRSTLDWDIRSLSATDGRTIRTFTRRTELYLLLHRGIRCPR